MAADSVVRRLRADEWERLRSLRLQALADAPMAFGSTLAREQAFPALTWQQRAAGDDDRVTFIAERRADWLGMVTCFLDGSEDVNPGTPPVRPAWIVGMWVSPIVRRQGAAQALLTAAAGWARTRGAGVLNLDVTETNRAAIALYERLGFHATGASQPLTHTPALRELRMACPLSAFRARQAG